MHCLKHTHKHNSATSLNFILRPVISCANIQYVCFSVCCTDVVTADGICHLTQWTQCTHGKELIPGQTVPWNGRQWQCLIEVLFTCSASAWLQNVLVAVVCEVCPFPLQSPNLQLSTEVWANMFYVCSTDVKTFLGFWSVLTPVLNCRVCSSLGCFHLAYPNCTKATAVAEHSFLSFFKMQFNLQTLHTTYWIIKRHRLDVCRETVLDDENWLIAHSQLTHTYFKSCYNDEWCRSDALALEQYVCSETTTLRPRRADN